MCYFGVMPRTLDRDERRALLSSHAWTLVAQGGVEWLTLRHLAEASGLSLGGVRLTVPGRHALDKLLADELSSRTQAHFARVNAETALRRRVALLLPADEATVTRARIEIQMRNHRARRTNGTGVDVWTEPFQGAARQCARDLAITCLQIVRASPSARAALELNERHTLVRSFAALVVGMTAQLIHERNLQQARTEAARVLCTFLALP